MKELEQKTTNEILFEIKQLQADHEALKLKMLKDYDLLVGLEMKFDVASKIIQKRLKGE